MAKAIKYDAVATLQKLGITYDDAVALRRVSMTLHRWHEHECNGAIQRDEESGVAFWYSTNSGKKLSKAPDREKGALKRLAEIIARYPGLSSYVQGDPRGAALYVLRPGDVPDGCDAGAYYSRGIVVY
jgi:hypothetical protein